MSECPCTYHQSEKTYVVVGRTPPFESDDLEEPEEELPTDWVASFFAGSPNSKSPDAKEATEERTGILDSVIASLQQSEFSEYQEDAFRTARVDIPPIVGGAELLRMNMALGLAGEVGELLDHLKKVQFHGHEEDPDYVEKELGDILWYVSGMATAFGLALDDVAERNIAKLKARYPEGFSVEDSLNRSE